MTKILVSACLLGSNCKWNGRNNSCNEVNALKDKFELIPVCSEVLSGMPIPRIPSEIRDDKVFNQVELDVTKFFISGAKKVLEIAINNDCHYAIFKDHSPSCGVHNIYNGKFERTLTEGEGMTTRLLKRNHIKVYSESEIDKLLKEVM